MKKLSLSLLVFTVLALGILAFTFIKNGGIRGTIVPADGATEVIAISATDTLRTTISNGSFTFGEVKPATYTIWVKGKLPYKDASVENVAVIDSTVTDVGEIKLQQ
ncbi:carboxypeptidase regulatory-like domain-containing protein [Pedobacter frigoris]|uniref:carboxypeptidase regulatory-like domain-containing protein n=1 Tax=Pedobacter frigoris TaxID=2571272 RepID=UPI00292F5614|nr:carboxypeptidase regulatory-like domain-containing protein [Pedobacter frigoris]